MCPKRRIIAQRSFTTTSRRIELSVYHDGLQDSTMANNEIVELERLFESYSDRIFVLQQRVMELGAQIALKDDQLHALASHIDLQADTIRILTYELECTK